MLGHRVGRGSGPRQQSREAPLALSRTLTDTSSPSSGGEPRAAVGRSLAPFQEATQQPTPSPAGRPCQASGGTGGVTCPGSQPRCGQKPPEQVCSWDAPASQARACCWPDGSRSSCRESLSPHSFPWSLSLSTSSWGGGPPVRCTAASVTPRRRCLGPNAGGRPTRVRMSL